MKTTEKFAILNALVVATKMTDEEIKNWLLSRQTLPDTTDDITISSTRSVKPILPIVYKKGNDFEILPELVLERKDDVWGYEIMPNIILAKKCGAVDNVENTTWGNIKTFAEKCILNGKKGCLPSKEVLIHNWSIELRDKIKMMDRFLNANGVNAEVRSAEKEVYIGVSWCFEENGNTKAYAFNLNTGNDLWYYKNCFCDSDRIMVSF